MFRKLLAFLFKKRIDQLNFSCYRLIDFENFEKGGLTEFKSEKNNDLIFLDSNHFQFLLVDDGSQKFGGEIDFRVNLEKAIAKKSSQDKYAVKTKE